jgi:hypothetical protein
MSKPLSVHPFDLQARAERAAYALTALCDEKRDGLMYFLATWQTRPPRADHCLWDCGDGTGRHIDALTLLRSILPAHSPEAAPSHAEQLLEAWMFRFLGKEGLSWLLQEPFSQPWGVEMLLHEYDKSDLFAEISWAQRGTLLGLTSRYRATKEECYAEAGQKLVEGLLSVAVKTSEGLYFPEGYYRASGWRYEKPALYPGIEEYNAAAIVPAVRFYRETGYAPALELAEGLLNYALKHTQGYLSDGSLFPGEGEGKGEGTLDHFHTRTNFLLGVLEFGIETGRRELISWARQSFEYAKRWGTDFGWFPEGMGHRHGETCCFADMIEASLLLGKHVDRSYYATAEQFGRNHLLESQFLALNTLEEALLRLPEDTNPAPFAGEYSTFEGVAQSQVGAFASRPTLNDAFHTDAPAMMQCCNAAGARALYDLWHYATEESAVHLHFSVETPHMRVVSYEPTLGRLDITPRKTGLLEVRLPNGISQALIEQSGCVSVCSAQQGYVTLHAEADQVASVHYTLPERTAHYEVGTGGKTASCTGFWRGETLMRVEPQGGVYPLYQRSLELPPVEPALPQGMKPTNTR